MKPAGEPLHPLTQLTVPISGRFLTISVEAVSIFVVEEENTIVTVQEKPGDCWVKVRENLKNPRSLVRDRDMHFLIYRLLDQTVDSLFPVVEGMLLLLHCYEMMLMTQGRESRTGALWRFGRRAPRCQPRPHRRANNTLPRNTTPRTTHNRVPPNADGGSITIVSAAP